MNVETFAEGKYRKKPLCVEAVQWNGDNEEQIKAFAGDAVTVLGNEVYIDTPEGMMRGSPGTLIIRGVRGEYYPVQNDIFGRTYEPVAA